MNKTLLLFLTLFMIGSGCRIDTTIENKENSSCTILEDINTRCSILVRSKNPKAKLLIDSAFTIVQENNCQGTADAYNNYGIYLFFQKKYENAIDTLKIASNIYSTQQDTLNWAKTIGNIGVMYKRLNKYEEALPFVDTSYQLSLAIKDTSSFLSVVNNRNIILSRLNKDSLLISQTLPIIERFKNYNNTNLVAHLYNNIGIAYFNRKVWDKALEYYRQEGIICQGSEKCLGQVYNNISAAYIKLNHLDSAYHYADKGEKLKSKLKQYYGLSFSYENKGIILRRQEKLSEALNYHKKALNIREQLKDQRTIKLSCFNIGNTLVDLERYKDAETYFEKGIEISKNISAKDYYYDELLTIGDFYSTTKQYQKSSSYYRNALELTDTLYESKKSKAFLSIEEDFKNKLLQKENEAKEKELQITQLRSLTLKIGLIATLIALIVLGYLLWINRKQNAQISKSFDKISQQNEATLAINKELKATKKTLEEKQDLLLKEKEGLEDKMKDLKVKELITIGKFSTPPNSIYHIESDGNYILIANDTGTHRERLTIKKTIELLPKQFAQIQKGIIVNTAFTKYDRRKQIVTLKDGREINLSKNHREGLENALLELS